MKKIAELISKYGIWKFIKAVFKPSQPKYTYLFFDQAINDYLPVFSYDEDEQAGLDKLKARFKSFRDIVYIKTLPFQKSHFTDWH